MNNNLFNVPQGSDEEREIFEENMKKYIYSLDDKEYKMFKDGMVIAIKDTINQITDLQTLLEEEIVESNRKNDEITNPLKSLVAMATGMGVAATNFTLIYNSLQNLNNDRQTVVYALLLLLSILETIPLSQLNYKEYSYRPITRFYHHQNCKKIAKNLSKLRRELYVMQYIQTAIKEHDEQLPNECELPDDCEINKE